MNMTNQNCQKPLRAIQDEAVQKTEEAHQHSQAKLIVQGISKGDDLYKKLQKCSPRSFNGKLKKIWLMESSNPQMRKSPIYQRRWLSYLLLSLRLFWWLIVLAWVGIGIYLLI